MVKAQEWLESKYSNKEKVRGIDLDSRKVINQLKEENRQKEQENTTMKQRIEEIELSKKLAETHIEQPPK